MFERRAGMMRGRDMSQPPQQLTGAAGCLQPCPTIKSMRSCACVIWDSCVTHREAQWLAIWRLEVGLGAALAAIHRWQARLDCHCHLQPRI